MDYIVTCNAGSSSVKLAVFNISSLEKRASASVENIGQSQPVRLIGDTTEDISVQSHREAILSLEDWMRSVTQDGQVVAVGHRIVHGGSLFAKPTLIDTQVVAELQNLQALDPEHMPASLDSLEAMQHLYAEAQHIACFDTAFFHNIPTNAQLLALPRKYYEQGLRRFGFHGLSYQYLLQDFAEHEGTLAANGKVIMAHLGSGCSLAATLEGKPIDMTMGFTPTSGVVMSTRSGDLDPGVVKYLADSEGLDATAFSTLVNHQSGLVGVSGLSADMHTLLSAQMTNPHAAEAVELFCYQISKAIGALATTIGGLNSLIFAGGIGERSAEIRRRICERLAFLGVELDETRNTQSERLISRDDTDVGVHVIHTDEAKSIAKLTKQVTTKGEN